MASMEREIFDPDPDGADHTELKMELSVLTSMATLRQVALRIVRNMLSVDVRKGEVTDRVKHDAKKDCDEGQIENMPRVLPSPLMRQYQSRLKAGPSETLKARASRIVDAGRSCELAQKEEAEEESDASLNEEIHEILEPYETAIPDAVPEEATTTRLMLLDCRAVSRT